MKVTVAGFDRQTLGYGEFVTRDSPRVANHMLDLHCNPHGLVAGLARNGHITPSELRIQQKG